MQIAALTWILSTRYNLACGYALTGRDDQSLELLADLAAQRVDFGMADDPEVKALMKLKGLSSAFVHADELAQMVCRELFMAAPQPSWCSIPVTVPASQEPPIADSMWSFGLPGHRVP